MQQLNALVVTFSGTASFGWTWLSFLGQTSYGLHALGKLERALGIVTWDGEAEATTSCGCDHWFLDISIARAEDGLAGLRRSHWLNVTQVSTHLVKYTCWLDCCHGSLLSLHCIWLLLGCFVMHQGGWVNCARLLSIMPLVRYQYIAYPRTIFVIFGCLATCCTWSIII